LTAAVHDEAKTTLSALLALVEQGEEVVIARNGEPVARLVRYQAAPVRQKGSWRGLPGWEAFRLDPGLLAPMTDQEMADEGWP
jgi:antitoxin (DNA-binding transcriptional repressor) of toxin-antitoxin stability system